MESQKIESRGEEGTRAESRAKRKKQQSLIFLLFLRHRRSGRDVSDEKARNEGGSPCQEEK